jgi:hypothetical protein
MRDALTLALGVVGLAWYYYCLLAIGWKPRVHGQKDGSFREFMSLSVNTIGVSLATFVGMLLGLAQVTQQVTDRLQGEAAVAAPVAGGAAAAHVAFSAFTLNALTLSQLQWIAAALYVLSLLLALWLWRRGGDATDPVVSNLGKSLLGLIGGALAIVLNLHK